MKPILPLTTFVLLTASSVVCAADPPQRSNMPSPPSTHAVAGDGVRQPGEKRDIVVYANEFAPQQLELFEKQIRPLLTNLTRSKRKTHASHFGT